MPIYTFHCENKKCTTKEFDELCKFTDIDKVVCPDCKSKRVEKQITTSFNVAFTNPCESSKWDNFTYRAGHNLEKAKKDRRKAEEQSHVGLTPYQDAEQIDLEKHDIDRFEGRIT